MRLRGLVILALVAALLGAPPRASAAANQLLDPRVTPGSGTVTTLFALGVRYDGAFPAASVTANVAGLSLPMLLASGTSTAGTWSAVAALPAGTWAVSFTAVATQGNQPTIGGPTITVSAVLAPASEPATVGPMPSSSPAAPSGRSVPVGTEPAPSTTPAPAAPVASAAASATPAPAPAPADAAVPAASTPTGGSTSPATGTGGGPSNAAAPAGAPATDGPGEAASGAPLAANASAGSGEVDRGGDSSPTASGVGRDGGAPRPGWLAAVLGGTAAVALGGLAVLLGRRRRRDERVATVVAAAPEPEARPERGRTARRHDIELPDDPIVAAMGLGRVESRDPPTEARRRGRRAR